MKCSPLIKEKEELELSPLVFGDKRASTEEVEFQRPIVPGRGTPDGECGLSKSSFDATLTLSRNTCTVPLSLEQASHCTFGDNAMLCISALSSPLLTYSISLTFVNSNIFFLKRGFDYKCSQHHSSILGTPCTTTDTNRYSYQFGSIYLLNLSFDECLFLFTAIAHNT